MVKKGKQKKQKNKNKYYVKARESQLKSFFITKHVETKTNWQNLSKVKAMISLNEDKILLTI